MHELIEAILKLNGIDPDQKVRTANGTNTAFGVLENWISGALDEIVEDD